MHVAVLMKTRTTTTCTRSTTMAAASTTDVWMPRLATTMKRPTRTMVLATTLWKATTATAFAWPMRTATAFAIRSRLQVARTLRRVTTTSLPPTRPTVYTLTVFAIPALVRRTVPARLWTTTRTTMESATPMRSWDVKTLRHVTTCRRQRMPVSVTSAHASVTKLRLPVTT